MAIESLSNITRAGAGAFTPQIPQVFVQPIQPADTGLPYIWIQTGLGASGQNTSIWFNDGVPS